ncbi:MAG: hypothetical protein V7603_1359 [Micromonosporaceae bacterium]
MITAAPDGGRWSFLLAVAGTNDQDLTSGMILGLAWVR